MYNLACASIKFSTYFRKMSSYNRRKRIFCCVKYKNCRTQIKVSTIYLLIYLMSLKQKNYITEQIKFNKRKFPIFRWWKYWCSPHQIVPFLILKIKEFSIHEKLCIGYATRRNRYGRHCRIFISFILELFDWKIDTHRLTNQFKTRARGNTSDETKDGSK